MKPNGFALPILILAIVGVMILGTGGYFLYQNQTKPTPVIISQPTPSPTTSSPKESTTSTDLSNWKTYTEKTYGFSITHDNTFAAEPRTGDIEGIFQLCIYNVGGQEKPCTASVDVYDNKQKLPLEQWTNQYATPIPTYGGIAKPSLDAFNGYPAMVVANETERVRYVSQGNYIYKIRNVADAPDAEVANTFKFTQ